MTRAVALALLSGCFYIDRIEQNPCQTGCVSDGPTGDPMTMFGPTGTTGVSGVTGPTTATGPAELGVSCSLSSACRSQFCATTCAVPPKDTSCATQPAVADATGPVLFFLDLTSGPNRGGLNDNGTFITLYGLRFGATRGDAYVTIGGVEVASYTLWNPPDDAADATRMRPRGLETIVVQPGGAVTGSNLDVVVSIGGKSSNALKFTVRPGDLFLVDPAFTGGSSDGSFAQPWTSPVSITATGVTAGDIVYFKGGTYNTRDPRTLGPTNGCGGAFVNLCSPASAQGSPGSPIAYVGYPGAPPVFGGNGSVTNSDGGIWLTSSPTHVTFANLAFTNASAPLQFNADGRRVIGCAFRGVHTVNSDNALLSMHGGTDVAVLGSYFYDGVMQGIRLQNTSNHVEIAYNELSKLDNGLILSSVGVADDVRVHDNLIWNINFAPLSVDSDLGTCSVYNNIVVDSGSPGLTLGCAGICTSTVAISNNTFFSVDGIQGTSGSYAMSNNLLFTRMAGAPYLTNASSVFVAPHANLFANGVSGSVFGDADELVGQSPQFGNPTTSVTSADFAPISGSPALNSGFDTGVCSDYFGVKRARGSKYDRGAIEVE